MTPDERSVRADAVRQALLRLHKAMIDAQRITYERTHGRIETTTEFLGLVLEHPQFEWIRALSAIIAALDEWREEAGQRSDESLEELLRALKTLLQPEGSNAKFTQHYWEMVESTPEVLVDHVKLWRLLDG